MKRALKALTFSVKTYGCTYNKADTERIRGVLEQEGYQETDFSRADIIILNSCAVKDTTENKILEFLAKLENDHRRIILCGCLPVVLKDQLDKIYSKSPNIAAITGPQCISSLPAIFEAIERGKKRIECLSWDLNQVKKKFDLPVLGNYDKVAILPIVEGCQGNCSYCCTKFARNAYYSYSSKRIERQFHSFLEQGKQIFWVTAQDCGCYSSGRMDLIDLLSNMAETTGDYLLRLGMTNPYYFLDNFERFIALYRNQNLFQFLHLPLQSGSDSVLRDMNRKYEIEPVVEKIKAFQHLFPYCTLSTDIICGFPTETEQDFRETISVINSIKPDVLNISQFSSRPGIEAKKYKPLPSRTKKKRSKLLSSTFSKIRSQIIRDKWQDWQGWAVFERRLKNGQGLYRNFAYIPVVLDECLHDGKVEIKIQVEGNRLRAFRVRD